MENKELELRMYGLVPYNISPIQQAIQFGHAVVEYGQSVKGTEREKLYNEWADKWKTFIILNGGTTNDNPLALGSLNQHLATLRESGVYCKEFYEPDLGDQLTAIVFIIDERVFNKEKYPDFEDFTVAQALSNLGPVLVEGENDADYYNAIYESWLGLIGGKKNAFLRTFLKNFRLA
jgi:hypothetical protein